MADSIIIKCGALGNRSAMPTLAVGELGYRTDEKALYIGTKEGNVRLVGGDGASDISTLLADVSALKSQIADITARLDAIAPNG